MNLHRGVFIGLFVKRRIGHIVIFAVQLIGGYPQPLTSSPILYRIMTDNSKIILTPSVHQVVFLFCLAKKTISIMRVVEIYKELFP
jgi:hypothetical protein